MPAFPLRGKIVNYEICSAPVDRQQGKCGKDRRLPEQENLVIEKLFKENLLIILISSKN